MQNKLLERNITLAFVHRIFTKRAFLPVVSVFMAEYIGLSFKQIAVVASVSSAVSFFSQIPTGYFADKTTRVMAMRVGGVLCFAGSLFYFIMPNYLGILLATLIVDFGYTFFGGAYEALIHDSLIALGRENEYQKIINRTQSVGLLCNIAIVSLTAMTYVIDPRLPFVLGSLAFLVLAIVDFLMTEPTVSSVHGGGKAKSSIPRSILPLLIFLGLLAAMYTGFSNFTNLGIKQAGVPTQLLGWLFGIASGVGAVGGWFMHKIDQKKFFRNVLIDSSVFVFQMFSLWTKNAYIAAFGFIISMAFWRYRKSLYEHEILRSIGGSRYKATLLSFMSTVSLLNEIWMPLAVGYAATQVGLQNVFGTIGAVSFVVLPVIGYFAIRYWKQNLHLVSLAQ